MDVAKRFSAPCLPSGDVATAVASAIGSAREFALRHRLAPAAAARLVVIVDELVGNLLRHGEPVGGEIAIALKLARDGGEVVLTFEDNCLPFDPRSAHFAGPDGDGGGVGLALVRAWTEIVSYGSRDGVNRLILRLPAETAA